jgi:hypothetical protein
MGSSQQQVWSLSHHQLLRNEKAEQAHTRGHRGAAPFLFIQFTGPVPVMRELAKNIHSKLESLRQRR